MGNALLGLQRKLLHSCFGDQRNNIGIHTEAGTFLLQVIGADHIHIFLRKLCAAVCNHVTGCTSGNLDVLVNNHGAIKLYEKLGFTPKAQEMYCKL